MIRTAFLNNVRSVSRIALRPQSLSSRTLTPCLATQPAIHTPSKLPQSARWYSAPAGLAKPEVEGRIMDLLKGFDKVTDQAKVSGMSHFSNDLGLDSLDTVEVVMAIEEVWPRSSSSSSSAYIFIQEFSIEIPDKEADAIHGIDKAVEYILSQPDAH
ncbi:MAG: hypothetical protein Q9168_000720 [Polycauliona sp. 1 TL-2023]